MRTSSSVDSGYRPLFSFDVLFILFFIFRRFCFLLLLVVLFLFVVLLYFFVYVCFVAGVNCGFLVVVCVCCFWLMLVVCLLILVVVVSGSQVFRLRGMERDWKWDEASFRLKLVLHAFLSNVYSSLNTESEGNFK